MYFPLNEYEIVVVRQQVPLASELAVDIATPGPVEAKWNLMQIDVQSTFILSAWVRLRSSY